MGFRRDEAMRGSARSTAPSLRRGAHLHPAVPAALIGFIVAVIARRDRHGDPAAAAAEPDRHTPSPTRTGTLVACIALAAVGLALANAVLSLRAALLLGARSARASSTTCASQLFDHVQRMPLAFFTRTQTGALQSRLNNDVDRRAAGGHDDARHRRVRTSSSSRSTLDDHVQARLAAHAADADRAARVHLSRPAGSARACRSSRARACS